MRSSDAFRVLRYVRRYGERKGSEVMTRIDIIRACAPVDHPSDHLLASLVRMEVMGNLDVIESMAAEYAEAQQAGYQTYPHKDFGGIL
jgi:hypothetical protein